MKEAISRIIRISLITVVLCAGAMASAAEEKETLVVDRFSQGVDAKGIPTGWGLEKILSHDSKISVEHEKNNSSLHLLSVNDTFGLRKELSFDIRKYPYFSWKWKVSRLPKGGDIRKKDTDDQAGQIYVVFPRTPTAISTQAVGYIWDSQAPAGLSGTSKAYSKMKYTVLQSGGAKLTRWLSQTRNVYEDYKRLFKEDPPPAGGVLIYINSQHTKSSAECYYADIFFSAKSPRTPKR